ncbi:MAG: tetratricopeptide repeat protein, partial [Bacteroidota bacterium]|nr:tetratricopeptide repeat protein [Bacteroidota bacterium]
MKNFINNLLSLTFILVTGVVFAQSEKPDPAILEAQDFVAEANDEFASNEFAAAESAYRKAVAKDPANTAAKYNMGNNYYRNKKYGEGMNRYIQAAEVAQTKAEKHKAFHNLGNAFYQQKDFKKAVEAYKNALRNDPPDEETRYNLALAKKEEEKHGGGGGDDENQDQNQ